MIPLHVVAVGGGGVTGGSGCSGSGDVGSGVSGGAAISYSDGDGAGSNICGFADHCCR